VLVAAAFGATFFKKAVASLCAQKTGFPAKGQRLIAKHRPRFEKLRESQNFTGNVSGCV